MPMIDRREEESQVGKGGLPPLTRNVTDLRERGQATLPYL